MDEYNYYRKGLSMPFNLSLSETINTNDSVSKQLLNKWNTSAQDILSRGVQGVSPIDPVDANRYKYDFYGLLAFMGVEKKYYYPHLLVNGLTSSTLYNGKLLDIKLIDLTILNQYYDAHTR